MVKFLVSLGANLEIPCKNGETALVYAAVTQQKPAIVETLVQAGANVNHLDSTQENLLLRAVRMHRADVLRALLSHETNDGVSTAFIDSAFKEAVMQPIRTDFPNTDFEQRAALEELKQVSRIDMIDWLIPLVSDCRLFSDHEIFDKCVYLHDYKDDPYSDCHLCHLLLRYGFAYSNLFFIPFFRKSEFYLSFASLLILTSDDRHLLKNQMNGLLREIRPDGRAHPELRRLNRAIKCVIRVLSNPLSLQDLCVITARTRLRGRMWSKIDTLPLPPLLKDKLKLV